MSWKRSLLRGDPEVEQDGKAANVGIRALNKRETATVLAALRLFQKEARDKGFWRMQEQFADIKPLSNKEIDALCIRINFTGLDTGTMPKLPFGGSHAPDCTYRMGHAAPCNCWRSDPKKNPEHGE